MATTPSGMPSKKPAGSTRNVAGLDWWDDVADLPRNANGGIGLVTTDGIYVRDLQQWLIGYDLDACRNPDTGELAQWAAEFIARHGNSYTEVTPSGCGLRQWILVDERPSAVRTKVRVPEPAMPGCPPTKRPELQVFGTGPAGYVTVSGHRLEGTSGEPLVATAEWHETQAEFGLGESDEPSSELPTGTGAVPTQETITRAVEKHAHGKALIAARWHEVVGETSSASEAFHMLAKLALEAANGYGEAAVDWLLACTAWGKGDVDDSRDPAKYTRRTWVERDVARAFRRMPPPASAVFEPIPDEPKERRKTRLVSVSKLWHSVGNDPFLVHQLLPRRGLARIFGDPGSGKTPFALSLACAVATGAKTWFGHEVDRKGPVVYMVGEDEAGVMHRLKAEALRLGIDGELRFSDVHLTTMPGQLLDPADVRNWVEDVLALSPTGVPLLIVDTQSRNFGAGDENSTKDMALFVHHLQILSDALDCLVLLVHHTGLTNKDRARGSIVALGGLDAEMRTDCETKGRQRVVKLTQTKSKNWATPDPLHGVLVPLVVGKDVKGREFTAVTLAEAPQTAFEDLSKDPALTQDVEKVLFWIADHQDQRVSYVALGKAVGVTPGRPLRSHLSTLINDLGLVTADEPTPDDRRGAYRLTERGVAAADYLRSGAKKAVDMEELLS